MIKKKHNLNCGSPLQLLLKSSLRHQLHLYSHILEALSSAQRSRMAAQGWQQGCSYLKGQGRGPIQDGTLSWLRAWPQQGCFTAHGSRVNACVAFSELLWESHSIILPYFTSGLHSRRVAKTLGFDRIIHSFTEMWKHLRNKNWFREQIISFL